MAKQKLYRNIRWVVLYMPEHGEPQIQDDGEHLLEYATEKEARSAMRRLCRNKYHRVAKLLVREVSDALPPLQP